MASIRIILGDQLSLDMSSLANIDKNNDIVMMAEVHEEATYVKHHKKKIAFVFSAMRHFAQHLEEQGINVNYTRYDDKDKASSIRDALIKLLHKSNIRQVVIAHPAEYRLLQEVKAWESELNITLDISADNRFLASQDFFSKWADGRKQLRMEYYYREMRKSHNFLMEQGKPLGGKWNYDADNRNKLPKNISIPAPSKFAPDEITREVMALVEEEFADHFGDLEPFHYAVTREQALVVLDEFILNRLPDFGTYQDAMASDQAWLFHSHVSFYINTGLLGPEEVMRAAERAHAERGIALNSVEGFIRQILGWREYVRGFYWHYMPNLKSDNYLDASRALPQFFWDGDTDMHCLAQCVKDTKNNSYAHHIQRLMVLGNFALLTGLSPDEVNNWYLLVYADAYEWVELPNVSGMVLFADGGNLASKPYAASGAYINKMSNYCQSCRYSVKEKTGKQACPFNYLYWDFLQRHKEKFASNPRMAMIYRSGEKMAEEKMAAMREDANTFLIKLENHEKV